MMSIAFWSRHLSKPFAPEDERARAMRVWYSEPVRGEVRAARRPVWLGAPDAGMESVIVR